MDPLTLISSLTGGLQDFGEAGQLFSSASGYEGNAKILDVAAKGQIVSGDQQAQIIRQQGDKFIARQRAMYAKAGVRFTGSPASVWAETEKNIQMDVINTKLNAAAKANDIGFQALQQRMAAGNARTAAVAQIGQGVLKIGTSLALSSGGATKPTSVGGGKNVTSFTNRGSTTYKNITLM
jgi:hypothetical protein